MSPRFAWPQYRDYWALSIEPTDLHFTGGQAPPGDVAKIDEDRRRLHLNPVSPWSTLRMDLTLHTTEDDPPGLIGRAAYVLISSTRTNTRVPVALEIEEDYFVGTIVIDRTTVGGAVDIAAHVIDGSGRIVGAAIPWTLVVDDVLAPVPPGAPPIDSIWIDFSAADSPPSLRAAKESYSSVSFDQPRPVLYLNSGVQGLQHILQATSAKNERRRLRDVLGTTIARRTLEALFREAQATVDVNEDDDGDIEIDLPTDPLLQQVCVTVADAIDSVASAEQLLRELHDQARRHQLWVELEHAFDTLTDHASTIVTVVEDTFYAK